HAGAEDRALRRVAVETNEPVEPDPDAHGDIDDRLRLIFTCCHPALSMDDRVALTLRTVAGLTPAQIARAFLVTEPGMDKRLVCARAKIKHAGIPYRVPQPHLMPERRDGVVLALLALMLLQHARTAARTDAVGDVVTLEEQDRSLWDRDAITEALTILRSLVPRAGRYGLQARIAACHLEASDAASTNFARIAELYDALAVIDPSPVVDLNRAVAVAMSQGPEVGLRLIDALVTSRGIDDYYLLPATRADLLRRMGRRIEAVIEYEKALQLAPSEAEKRYLGKRLAETRR
ncbi:MAG: RNA polymerase subunit sigma-24, partial [Candidatus Saccharibacteria bacterium]|nr:RNA polymerase subunit sigma-24 [Microbacteriaceae bacterium]